MKNIENIEKIALNFKKYISVFLTLSVIGTSNLEAKTYHKNLNLNQILAKIENKIGKPKNIDDITLKAIIAVETKWKKENYRPNKTGAAGPGQLRKIAIKEIVQETFKKKDPKEIIKITNHLYKKIQQDEKAGIKLTEAYLSILENKYKITNWKKLLHSYDFGLKAKHIKESKLPKETRFYDDKVLAYKNIIKKLKEKGLTDKEVKLKIQNSRTLVKNGKIKIIFSKKKKRG